MQERLVVARAKDEEAAKDKRDAIGSIKAKKVFEINQMMQSIDRERELRRQKRMNKSLPDRGLSCLSSLSMSTDTSEFKELLWEKDGRLKALQSKIMAKKNGTRAN